MFALTPTCLTVGASKSRDTTTHISTGPCLHAHPGMITWVAPTFINFYNTNATFCNTTPHSTCL